jgi:hypothetical protein
MRFVPLRANSANPRQSKMPSTRIAGKSAVVWLRVIAMVLSVASVITPNSDARGNTRLWAEAAQEAASQPAAARPVGTIKSIAGNTITLTTDAGIDVTILVQEGSRLVRVAPGQKDLKDAAAIQPQDLQVGDRLLVRGKLAYDGKSVFAASIIAMKKADVAEKQAHDREEWQLHGVSGLVSSLDSTTGAITITTNGFGTSKTVVVRTSKDTILRRYASRSVKFDDAKPGPLSEIKLGDQLRARGMRSADGSELAADEIVSGSFRNIAGTISAVDAGAGTISVADLVSKKSVTIAITSDSQLRKLPPPMAQRIAMRLKGALADTSPNAPSATPSTPRPGETSPGGGGFGAGRPGGGGADFQQMISRMPPAKLTDLQKGDAVMIVATEGSAAARVTAITLLSGVEPLLEASLKGAPSTILSPWSLSAAPGGDTGTPQ